ncbi:hypothetical protein ACFL35_14485 [Candidatus Riflebacteria bacterium]
MEKKMNWKIIPVILSLICVAACSITPVENEKLSYETSTTQKSGADIPGGNIQTRFHVGNEILGRIKAATSITQFDVASLTFTVSDTRATIEFTWIVKEFAYSSGGVYNLGLVPQAPVKIDANATTSSGVTRFKGSKNVVVASGTNNFGVIDMFQTQDDGTPLSGLDITGINTSAISTSTVTIGFSTSQDALTVVEYGLSSSTYSATTTLELVAATTHSTIISGLTASNTYYYRILATISGGAGQDNKLVTSGQQSFNTSNTQPPILQNNMPDVHSPIPGNVFSASTTWTFNENVMSYTLYLGSTSTPVNTAPTYAEFMASPGIRTLSYCLRELAS